MGPVVVSSLRRQLTAFRGRYDQGGAGSGVDGHAFKRKPRGNRFSGVRVRSGHVCRRNQQGSMVRRCVGRFIRTFLLLFLPIGRGRRRQRCPYGYSAKQVNRGPPFPVLPCLGGVLSQVVSKSEGRPNGPNRRSNEGRHPGMAGPFPSGPVIVPSPITRRVRRLRCCRHRPVRGEPRVFLLPRGQGGRRRERVVNGAPTQSFHRQVRYANGRRWSQRMVGSGDRSYPEYLVRHTARATGWGERGCLYQVIPRYCLWAFRGDLCFLFRAFGVCGWAVGVDIVTFLPLFAYRGNSFSTGFSCERSPLAVPFSGACVRADGPICLGS